MARPIESYRREQAILNKVLESEKGLVATFNTASEAKTFRLNCWAFRALDRDLQSDGLEMGDPTKGTSPYDLIKFELVTNYKTKTFQVTLRNCKNILQAHGIEELISLDDGTAVDVALAAPQLSEEETKMLNLALQVDAGTLEDEMEKELEGGDNS